MSEARDAIPLLSEQRGPVLVLTLNRPDRRNALSADLVSALLGALGSAAADASVGAIVLAGAGSHFCAGGDLGPGGMLADGFLAQHESRADFARLLLALAEGDKPVVAAVHGDALGGGTGLVAACHLVVAAPQVSLSTPELKLGLFPWMIAPVLARKLPANLLHEMILCGRKLGAEEARGLGLVNRILPPESVLDGAVELASKAASTSPAVRRMGLQALAATADLPLAVALDRMHAGLGLNLLTEDAAEGVAAFLQRREPRWTGR